MYVQRKNRETDQNHGHVVIFCGCVALTVRERERARVRDFLLSGGENLKKSLSNSTCFAEKSSRWILYPLFFFFFFWGKILYYYFLLIIRETVNFNLHSFAGNTS